MSGKECSYWVLLLGKTGRDSEENTCFDLLLKTCMSCKECSYMEHISGKESYLEHLPGKES